MKLLRGFWRDWLLEMFPPPVPKPALAWWWYALAFTGGGLLFGTLHDARLMPQVSGWAHHLYSGLICALSLRVWRSRHRTLIVASLLLAALIAVQVLYRVGSPETQAALREIFAR